MFRLSSRFHMKARESFIRRMECLGIENIVLKSPDRDRCDFELDGRVRVALRFSRIKPRTRRVTVGGKRYTYVYPSCTFNFHCHGKLIKGVDLVICVVSGRDDYFCIPLAEITGKTFCLCCKKMNSIASYHGKYRIYHNTFRGLKEVLAEKRRIGEESKKQPP